MKQKEYLKEVRKQIFYIFDRNSIEEELKEHLQDSIQNLLEEGFSYEEAEKQAVLHMGDPVETGKMLNKVHRPLLGYFWMLSQIIVIMIAILAPISILTTGYMSLKMLTPTTVKNSTKITPVNVEFEISTHRVKIDNICMENDGEYNLTYRAWIKRDYSRAGWSSDLFYIHDKEGNSLREGGFQGNSILGCYGSKTFQWPLDNVLYLTGKDGTEVKLNLKEYIYE